MRRHGSPLPDCIAGRDAQQSHHGCVFAVRYLDEGCEDHFVFGKALPSLGLCQLIGHIKRLIQPNSNFSIKTKSFGTEDLPRICQQARSWLVFVSARCTLLLVLTHCNPT